MHNTIIIIYRHTTDTQFSYSLDSWKKWGMKYNYPVFESPYTSELDKYRLKELLDESGIECKSILITDDKTLITPNCTNFIKDSKKILSARWFGKYGDLFKLKQIAEKDVDIDNWISTNMIYFPIKEYEKISTSILNNTTLINKFQPYVNNSLLGNYDPYINFIDRNIDNEYQLGYDYNMCNMHVNELLSDDLKFTKLNPKILNFNDLKPNITEYLLERTYKHYYE